MLVGNGRIGSSSTGLVGRVAVDIIPLLDVGIVVGVIVGRGDELGRIVELTPPLLLLVSISLSLFLLE